MRVFLAIELPNQIKNSLKELMYKMEPYSKYIKLTPTNNLHFTLKFLGEQNDLSIERIKETAKKEIEQIEAFNINIDKSGIFGSIKNPKIVWLGQDNANFVSSATRINSALEMFRFEPKPPVCHLTIGRIKRISAGDITEVIKICKDFVSKNNLRFCASRVYLYKSILSRNGAIYEKIENFKMKGSC